MFVIRLILFSVLLYNIEAKHRRNKHHVDYTVTRPAYSHYDTHATGSVNGTESEAGTPRIENQSGYNDTSPTYRTNSTPQTHNYLLDVAKRYFEIFKTNATNPNTENGYNRSSTPERNSTDDTDEYATLTTPEINRTDDNYSWTSNWKQSSTTPRPYYSALNPTPKWDPTDPTIVTNIDISITSTFTTDGARNNGSIINFLNKLAGPVLPNATYPTNCILCNYGSGNIVHAVIYIYKDQERFEPRSV